MTDRPSMAPLEVAIEAMEAFDRGVRDMDPYLERMGALVDEATDTEDIPTMILARRLYQAVTLLEFELRREAGDKVAWAVRRGGRE